MQPEPATSRTLAAPGLGLLLRLKAMLLRNRLRQLTDQRPLQLLIIIFFVGGIWAGLYLIFDRVFVLMRRFEEPAIIAIPYVFHVFFLAMTLLLAFSTAVLVYGSLFGRDEAGFLLATPTVPSNVVAIMYLESLFYSSWSLLLLGLPLMTAIGQVRGLPWHFYPTFILAFIGFVPIPGALGLLAALLVALYLPRIAKRTVLLAGAFLLLPIMIWWGRLWTFSGLDAANWLDGFLLEIRYLKNAVLPSSWVAKAIQLSIEDKPSEAFFYVAVTVSTALFVSWWATLIVARKLLPAFSRAHIASHRARERPGWASAGLTRIAFFYLPTRMRELILKDMRNFLRDPMQWSQLAILFGLLSLYLFYLPRSRPEGFTLQWQALICFLNYGAVTLILSTFTSRFVFPMISLEGNQIWLVGLWPMSRSRVIWAKLLFAATITTASALSVTYLSIRALDLPPALAGIQLVATVSTCLALCGLAIGLGARMPSYREADASRIASGLGGTINLIASVAMVAFSVALFGAACWYMLRADDLGHVTGGAVYCTLCLVGVSMAAGGAAMRLGLRSFRRQEF